MNDCLRLQRLEPPAAPVRAVLDTDAYNEIDDQFALAYALLSAEACTLEAVYAAPFHNSRSSGPGDGMERSYGEILRVFEVLGRSPGGRVFRGAGRYLADAGGAVDSPAVRDLLARALGGSSPLYVMSIGAPTNVASAILLEPTLVEHVVVVWLGGQPQGWHTAREFNLRQDLAASRVLFDSGVPLVQIPCTNVAEHLRTTVAELEAHLRQRSAVGDYLCDLLAGFRNADVAWSKVIWDVAAVAYLVNPAWVPTVLRHSPLLTDQVTYSLDPGRHLIREALHVDRDAIFRDMFAKCSR